MAYTIKTRLFDIDLLIAYVIYLYTYLEIKISVTCSMQEYISLACVRR